MILLALLAIAQACPFAALLKAQGVDLDAALMKSMHAAHAERKRTEHELTKRQQAGPVAQTFELTSRVKTSASKVFNQGFPVGFAVNGVETPDIDLIAGKTYNFVVNSSCAHPFYLSFDSRGKGRSPVTVGWTGNAPTALNGTRAVCGGKSILFTPPTSLIGKQITYQCFVHDNMGWNVNIKKQSFCDKYTEALKNVVINNAGLVGTVVGATIAKLVEPSSPLLEYFDGTIPAGSTNFLADAQAGKKLGADLVAFFGAALGCSDGSIPPYTGRTMKVIHASMPIGAEEYDNFVKILGGVLTGYGVEPEDLTPVVELLNSAGVRGAICNVQNSCFPSICNKYSMVKDGVIVEGSSNTVMATFVDKTFMRVLGDATLLPFFNGKAPAGSKDFTMDTTATTALKARFVAFVGGPEVLSCTDPKFPSTAYKVADLLATHANMPITTELFNKFNDHAEAALADMGVMPADIRAIRAVLNSTEPLICTQPGCSRFPVTSPVDTTLYKVGIAPKMSGHHFFGKGFAQGYLIDGAVKEGLQLVAGKTYIFQSNVSCFHPFYLSTGNGAGTDEVTEGVSVGAGESICAGKSSLTFTPTAAQVGSTLYYGCRNHDFMGGRICVVAAASGAACTISSAPVIPPSQMSPCDDLTAAVKNKASTYMNSKQVITDLVVDVFLAGAVTSPAPLKKYFDGTQVNTPDPSGKVDFITAGPQQMRLVGALVKFFGTNLGCSDNSIELYAAGEQPNMKTVHQFMNIKKADFETFNTVLANFAKDFKGMGVGMSNENLAKVGSFLAATSPDICVDCADSVKPTLCEKWASASKKFKGDQKKMVEAIVVGTFTKEVGKADAKVFFDGSVPCKSRDFINDLLNQAALVKTLTAFFGQSGVLGCTQPNFPQFKGNSDMEEVHQFMPITKAIFDGFIGSLVDTVKAELAADVPSLNDDLMPVGALLNSPAISIMCNQAGCPNKGKFTAKPGCAMTSSTMATTAGGNMTNVGVTTTTGTTKPMPVPSFASLSSLSFAALVVALAARFF